MRVPIPTTKFLISCVLLIAASGVLTSLSAHDGNDRGATSFLLEEESGLICVGEEPARIVAPHEIPGTPPGERCATVPQKTGQNWILIDSLRARAMIPAGKNYVVRFDHRTGLLEEISPEEGLSGTALQALERAPRWLYDDLKDSFFRLGDMQDTYASLVLNAQSPCIDEIAWQVAHIAPETLTDPQVFLYLHMLVENAELLYEIDGYLDYVDIVDTTLAGDPDDYYSTTRYRVISDGDTVWTAIPKEYYYWYIVHPKISDEDVKMTDEASERQSTYGYFWREYLFYDPSAEHSYTEGGYPLLQDCLDSVTVLWDGQLANLSAGRPFAAGDMALDVISNWTTKNIPSGAYGNRPVQPNQIVREHNGNCGEFQDLLCAAARTALVPAVCACDICDDHVWNEFYWDGEWHPYQADRGGAFIDNPWIAYDVDYGANKQVSAIWDWRGDGFQWAVTGRYSDSCVLIATVHDFEGNPVDGARVRLYADPHWGGDLYITTWGYTDSDGRCQFELGDHRDIYARVQTSLGDYPPGDGTLVKIIDMSIGGQTYHKPFTVPGVVGGFEAQEAEASPGAWDRYQVEIDLDAFRETGYGMNLYDGNTFARQSTPGRLDFFVCDSANYALFAAGEPFEAHEISFDMCSLELTFPFPAESDWYLVFTSRYMVTNRQCADIAVELYESVPVFRETDIVSLVPEDFSLSQNYPNPFNPATEISYRLPRGADVTLDVYNTLGQRIRTLVSSQQEAGVHRAAWDGRDGRGEMVSSGVYFYRLCAGEFARTKKMVLLR
jgi:hypothetical protein